MRDRVAPAATLGVAAALGAGWLATACAAAAASDNAADTVIEEVLVTGVQPGPGLWRVTRPTDNGEHVLWIMGQYHTLPKKMEWRSTELEAAIAGSQELLAEPEVDAEWGLLRSWARCRRWSACATTPTGAGSKSSCPSSSTHAGSRSRPS